MTPRRHHTRLRIDAVVLQLFVAALQVVGDGGVGAVVVVPSHHAADFQRSAALLVVAALQHPHMEEFVSELGPVVVGVQNREQHSGGGAQWRGAIIGNNHLETEEEEEKKKKVKKSLSNNHYNCKLCRFFTKT